MYDEELPIEDYIYTEALKERHEDTERFKALIEMNDSSNEDAATELLYVSKRLFYNYYGLDKIMDVRNQVLHFWDVETDDDTIPASMNSHMAEHDDLIEEILNSLGDLEDLHKMNLKKLSNRHPELPFLTLIKIVLMDIMEEPTKKIMSQLDDALSIYPDDILLKLQNDTLLSRNGKKSQVISDSLISTQKASVFFKRKTIHSFELMSLHTAIYEHLTNNNDLLMLDALMFASQTLYPEWEEAWGDKELFSEIMKVDFCKLIVKTQ